MKKIAFLFLFGSVFLAGCPKHEIIPAPTPEADLQAHFEGTINGTDVELTQNVEGYFLLTEKSKDIEPSPTPSTAVYHAEFKSEQTLVSMRISLGSIIWDGSISDDPTLNLFNTFFSSTLTPNYTIDGESGFEVTYRDGLGNVWTSDPASPDPKSVVFSNVTQESDIAGDYSKFRCTFNCTVYRTVGPDTFSLLIEDAVYEGWFQR